MEIYKLTKMWYYQY